MQTKALGTLVFAAAMLLAQAAHAGWIMDWIHCSEDCGWVCGCDGGELTLNPKNPKEKKAAQEIMKVMRSFQSNIRSLSPDAKKLLERVDKGGEKTKFFSRPSGLPGPH